MAVLGSCEMDNWHDKKKIAGTLISERPNVEFNVSVYLLTACSSGFQCMCTDR